MCGTEKLRVSIVLSGLKTACCGKTILYRCTYSYSSMFLHIRMVTGNQF